LANCNWLNLNPDMKILHPTPFFIDRIIHILYYNILFYNLKYKIIRLVDWLGGCFACIVDVWGITDKGPMTAYLNSTFTVDGF
jgi:hypothetical protein